jgi:hypothetical protein
MATVRPLAGNDLARMQPTLAQLGAVFGTSGRWIGALRSKGVLPPDGATLAENVAAWVAYRGDGNA